ncbi:MAG TPA: hypothetical protein VIL84_14135 [Devosiaceae bacterium]
MKSIRLLPVVVLAACALLAFKTIGLVTQGGYVLTGAGPAIAQAANSAQTTDPAISGNPPADAASRAADALFSKTEPPPADAPKDAVPVVEKKNGTQVPLAAADGKTLTEQQVLERLAERRAELDKQAQDLDQRQQLVAAAEQKLQERIDGLKALEARINALVAEKKAMDDKQFASLIAMYESMRPADAARIFDKLTTDVLVRVARAMNPRKLGPIVAQMDAAVAQDLTVRLADIAPEPSLDKPIQDISQLPQIVGQ